MRGNRREILTRDTQLSATVLSNYLRNSRVFIAALDSDAIQLVFYVSRLARVVKPL